LASIRQQDGTPLKDFKGRVTSHLSGLFYRTIKLLESGIKPIYVFDGEPPPFKAKEREKRREHKEEALLKLEKAEDLEELEKLKSYAQATAKLTPEMVEESKALLRAMGIPVVEAPSEGEAEAAYLAAKGKAYASSSQDYDSLLFGSPRLARNLSISGRRKLPRRDEYVVIHPELIELERNLKEWGITRDQLIYVGILVGTDFNEGVKGVGPKTALKIVKTYKTWDAVRRYVESRYGHTFEDYIDEVIAFFKNPPVRDAEVKMGPIDGEAILRILVEEHDFSEERVRSHIEKLKELRQREGQSKLSAWFS